MKYQKLFRLFAVLLLLVVAVVVQADEETLTSVSADESPVLDGVADDAAWEGADSIVVEVRRGANVEESVVTLKSVYTEDMVYFLVTWDDPTFSWMRFPWEMQDDGTWIQLKDPENMGGDENIWYEDKFAFIWEINEIEYFADDGCFAACHLADDEEDYEDYESGKPYGNKFADEDGLGDIWHWKSVRNVGQAHDQYLDGVVWSEETGSAGRHADPKDEGGYSNNVNEDKTAPAFMVADAPKDGSPGHILAEEAVEFDASLFEAGDRVPGIVVSPFVGDAADISAGWLWADGVWTLELARALVTDSENDVQFDDMSAEYLFGVAPFDNAQVRHMFHRGVLSFVFGE
jgi:hypothetical protein